MSHKQFHSKTVKKTPFFKSSPPKRMRGWILKARASLFCLLAISTFLLQTTNSLAQNNFFQNSILTTSANYSTGTPTNTSDVQLTTPTTTLDLSAANAIMRSLSINNGQTYSINYNTNSATNRTLTLGNPALFTNPISGVNNDVLYVGSGSLNFSGANTASNTGVTNLVLASSGNFNVNTGASLTIGSATGGVISGAFNITKTGAGSLTLLGTNTYTGSLTLTAGTLNLNNASAVGTTAASLIIGNGTTIDNTSGSSKTLVNKPQSWGGAFTFTGSNPLNMGTGAIAMTAASQITTNSSNPLTLGGAISGAFPLTLVGSGIIISNGINSYTGGTTLNGPTLTLAGANTTNALTTLTSGTLNFNNATAIGTGAFTINGGTLDNTTAAAITNSRNNTQTWGGDFSFTGTQNLNLGTGTVTLGGNRIVTVNNNTLTIGGIVSGAFSLTKAGNGILTLSGANTYTGGTTVSTGTLNMTGANNFTAGSININGGTLTLSGGNTTTGTTTLNSGLLNFNNAAAIGTGNFAIYGGTFDNSTAAAITNSKNNPQTWGGNFAFTGTQALNLGTGTVTLSANTTATINANNLTIGGTVNGAFSLTKAGNGVLTLTGSNTHSGGTTLTAGTLNFNNASAIGTGNFIVNGGIIDNSTAAAITNANNNNQTWGGDFVFTGTKSLNLGTGTVSLSANRTVTTNASTLTIGGAISGAFALTKAGAGTLTLGGANTFNGGVNLNAGILNLSNAAALGTGQFTIATGTTFDNTSGVAMTIANNNTFSFPSSCTFTGTQSLNIGTAPVSLAQNASITTTANILTIPGAISGAFSLTKAGAGTLALTGNNSYTGGTTLSAGILTLSGSNTTIGTTTVSGGTININSTNALGSGPLNITAASTINNSSAAALTLATNNTQSWGGDITYTGTQNLNMGTGAVTLLANRIITTSAGILTIGGPIGGGYKLTKSGTGSLTLNGTNTYTGGTLLTAGNLYLGSSSSLSTGLITITGGTIDNLSGGPLTLPNNNHSWGGNFTFVGTNNLNLGTGNVALTANNTVTVTNAGKNLTVGGIVSGAFKLTKAGNGTLYLNNANTFSGGTTLTTGLLNLGNASAIGSGNFTIGTATFDNTSGSAMDFTTANNNPIFMAGAFTFTGSNSLNLGTNTTTMTAATTATVNANTLTIGGVVGGAFGLTKSGVGSLTLGGINTYSGGTTLNGGTLNIGNKAALGTGTLTISGATNIDNVSGVSLTNSNNNPLTINQNLTFIGTNSFNMGTGNVTLSSARTLTVNANNLTLGGNISGAVALTKAGVGALTLAGLTNTNSGGLSLTAGTLNLNSATALGTGTFTISGGTFDNTSGASIINTNNNVQSWGANPTFTGTNSYDLGTGGVTMTAARTVTVNGNTLTVGGAIGGAFALTKAGTGSLVLNGINTYTGGTTVSAGTLTLGGASTTTGLTTLSNGATLNINQAATLGTGNLTIAGGTIDNTSGAPITNSRTTAQTWSGDFAFTGSNSLNMGTGTVTLSANRTVTTNANTLTIGGIINGAGFSLTKTGSGTLALTGANTYSGGTTVNAGTLTLSGSNNGAVNVTSTGTLAINTATCMGNNTLTMSGGNLNNASGSAITLSSTTPQTWAGDFVFIGSNNLNMGTGPITLSSNRTVTLTANTLTLGGGIGGGSNTLTLTGASGVGTLTCNGANTYTGATTINGATLNINSTHTSGITINNGGILSGTGSINNTITINSGGTFTGTGTSNNTVTVNGNISPGGVGTQSTFTTITASGNMVWNNGGIYTCDITSTTSTACDKLAIGGSLATPASGNFTIKLNGTISGFNSGVGASWIIGSYSSGSPSNANITIDASGITNPNYGVFTVAFASNTITLNYSPEVDAPPFANDLTIVYNGLSNSISSISASNCVTDWYTVASGGTAVLTSSNSTPASTSAGVYTYYGESRDITTGVKSLTRTKVILTINQAPLTITGISGTSKIYNGNTSAPITGTAAYSGLVNGESFTISGTPTFTFPSKHVGTGLVITVSGFAAPSANYSITQPTGLTGDITPYPLTITAQPNSKVFDNTYATTVSPTISSGSVQPSDNPNFTELYTTNDVGSGLTLVPTGSVLDGNSGNDYTYTFINNNSGVITPALLTVTANNKTVIYPNAAPSLTYTITGVMPGDMLSLVTSGVPTLTTTYTATNPLVTSYPITISAGSLVSNGDYIFNYVNATLTVSGCIAGTWFGSTSSDASVASNWCNATLPTSSTDIVILSGGSPTINANTTLLAKNITVSDGASLMVSGTLKIAGSVNSIGALDASAGGTIEYNGSTPQTINAGDFDNDSICTLVVNNSAGVSLFTDFSINGFLRINSGKLDLVNNNITLRSNANATAQVGTVTGTILYSGTGRFVVERFINNNRRGYRNISSSGILSDGNIFANWQENGSTSAGYGTQITGEKGAPGYFDASSGIDYSLTGSPSMWTYNTSDAFVPVTNTMTPVSNQLIPFVGYYALIRGDRTYDLFNYTPVLNSANTTLRTTGKILSGQVILSSNSNPVWAYSGTVASTFRLNNNTTPSGKNNSDYGYSLIANPYACVVDWNSVYARSFGLSNAHLSKYYWVWNQAINGNIGGFVTVDNTGIANVNASSTATTNNNYLQPGQSFFVVNDHSGNDIVVDFEESDKYVSDNSKIKSTFSVATAPNLIRFGLNRLSKPDTILTDGAVVKFDTSGINTINKDDAPKFSNPKENIAIFLENTDLSIEDRQLPAINDTISLHIWNVTIDSSYILNIDASALSTTLQPYVYDRYLGTMMPLSYTTNNNISFTPTQDANTYNFRFGLVFGKTTTLPVSFVSFTSSPENGQNHLDWVAINNGQTLKYIVERSRDGKTFDEIGEVLAGKETGKKGFSFYDTNPLDGDNYYRIVAIGAGSPLTSTVVSVGSTNKSSIKIYPTLVTDNHTTIHLQQLPKGSYNWRLYDEKGAVINQQSLTHDGGNGAYDIFLSTHKLPQGMYDIVVFSSNNRILSEKLTVH